MGPAMFCSSLRRGPDERFLVEVVSEAAEAFAYLNDITRDLMAVAASTVRALPFLQRELDEIGEFGIVVNSTKTAALALPLTGHVSMTEGDASLLEV